MGAGGWETRRGERAMRENKREIKRDGGYRDEYRKIER